MPKKFDDCVKAVERKILKGKIKKTYLDKKGKRKKSSPYAICRRTLKTKQ